MALDGRPALVLPLASAPSRPADRSRDAHQRALLEAAERLGVEAEDHLPDWGLDAVTYRSGGHAVTLVDGRVNAGLSYTAAQLCLSKPATRAILAELGVPVPEAVRLPGASDAALAALVAGGPVVVKPPDGEWGDGVAMDLTDVAAVRAHAAFLGGRALVERQVAGRDLRIQALGGRVVAACVREPAAVVGDGRTPLAALVEARAREVARLNPDNRLEVDADTRALLAEQGLALDVVPAAGRTVRLKRAANLSLGGRAVDVTDALHPRYRAWTAAVADRLGLDVFAVDAVTPDPAADPAEAPAWVLEVNAPCQWLAHTFSERRRHDLPAQILRHLLSLPDPVHEPRSAP